MVTIFLRESCYVFAIVPPNIISIISFRNSKSFNIFKIPLTFQNLNFLKKLNVLPSKILSSLNFVIGVLLQTPKLSEFYSDCVNLFCLCRTCVRGRQHMRVWSPLNIYFIQFFLIMNRNSALKKMMIPAYKRDPKVIKKMKNCQK